MTEFNYTNNYMTKDGKPWFPMMGEMHYSRYDRRYWAESIYKMKAGGIDILSAYTLWIHHEEKKGEYDFTGNRDLRKFVETCKACGIYMFLRIGPWCHAEARNGAFPDWIVKTYGDKARTNDEAYLKEVETYYTKIYEQVEGLFLKDGGPIIGLQIENEYGHCGGLNGEEGEKHMRTLTDMAKRIGYDVPLYTATGWGGAVTGGLLPVMGGYCESPWDQRITEIEPSGNYIYTHERNDHNIGSDFGFGTGITFDIDKFPYLTAELGGGLQVTHHRRPVATGTDIGAVTNAKLGSGVSLLGYYMYHGGTNPDGKYSTLQETKATGYLNELPEKSYDFNAPIREFGQLSGSFKEIKMIAMFLKDFGSEFCEMPAHIPAENPLYPTNLEDLRSSYRHNGKKGYVFVNNYQRKQEMKHHEDVVLSVALDDETITFPKMNIKNGEYFFYPFNMNLGNATLKTACATPLCKINDSYIFYTDGEPKYDIEGELGETNLVTISRNDALNAFKIVLDKEYLVISDNVVLQAGNEVTLLDGANAKIKVYPAFTSTPKGLKRIDDEDGFAIYASGIKRDEKVVNFQRITMNQDVTKYRIDLELVEEEDLNNVILCMDYAADSGRLYLNGKLIDDSFYTGQTWEVGLREFGYPKELSVEFYPLHKQDKIYLETWPQMENEICELQQIKTYSEYKYTLFS